MIPEKRIYYKFDKMTDRRKMLKASFSLNPSYKQFCQAPEGRIRFIIIEGIEAKYKIPCLEQNNYAVSGGYNTGEARLVKVHMYGRDLKLVKITVEDDEFIIFDDKYCLVKSDEPVEETES